MPSQHAFASVEKARDYMNVSNNRGLLFLTQDGFAYCHASQVPPGGRLISVGFFGTQGQWVEHIQDFGYKPMNAA
jgi:hypothetical protein